LGKIKFVGNYWEAAGRRLKMDPTSNDLTEFID